MLGGHLMNEVNSFTSSWVDMFESKFFDGNLTNWISKNNIVKHNRFTFKTVFNK